MSTREDLQKTVKDQETQLVSYEKKFKDVVRAYKSIESEKKVLEVALSALTSSSTTAADDSATAADKKVEQNSEKEGSRTPEEQFEALKQAITTLTIENKKRELAFQSDRKSLLATKEKLAAEIDELRKSTAANPEVERRLRERLADMESQREKMMTEHGSVVAEMQQRYAKERKHAEKMEKQVTQLSYRLQEKDDVIQSMETRAKKYAQIEQEVQQLRKKAEANPTAQVLKQELVNVKDCYEKELSSVRRRHAVNSALLNEKDARICVLEERIKSLSAEGAAMALDNAELRQRVTDLSRQLASVETLKRQDDTLSLAQNVTTVDHRKSLLTRSKNADVLTFEIRAACLELKTQNCSVLSELLRELSDDLAPTNNAAVVVSSTTNGRNLIGRTNSSSADDSSDADELSSEAACSSNCDRCSSAQREAADCKARIRELQRKLRFLEEMNCSTKEEHIQTSDALKQRIAELETNQKHVYSQLSFECMEKVMEMEEELRCQQIRMREIISEKDKEIEYARHALSSIAPRIYNNGPSINGGEHGGGSPNDPLDPEPRSGAPFDGELRKICEFGSTSSVVGLLTFVDAQKSSHSFVGGAAHRQSSTIETRNIFYEQKLSKREQEIVELRNVMRLSELKVRDIEQAMLTKDIQYLQIVETLKEEIRILEGKLSIEQSETNLAYLRNVFVQLINSNSTKSRKHILKAIGAVLKLTNTEMKRIESWNA